MILDLSYPPGNSINDGINKNKYLDRNIELSFPNVDSLVEIVKQKGRGCLMFKRDLKRAYRQIQVDPKEINLLGYEFNSSYYFDVTLPMGLRSAAYICQRVTNALVYIFNTRGYTGVNYIDDLASAETPEIAEEAYQWLGEILARIGILESLNKAVAPTTIMEFLGVQLNSILFTLSLSDRKMKELQETLSAWGKKKSATLNELQKLIGVLSYTATIIQEGRLFFSRILNFLKARYSSKKSEKIPAEVQKDIKWWQEFAPHFNGTRSFDNTQWLHPDCLLHTDACLTGVGGFMNGLYFRHEIPENVKQEAKNSNHCEIYAILVAVKAWYKQFEGKNIQIYCDNTSSVDILRSGRSACKFSQSVLREIRHWSARYSFKIRGVHLPGVENVIVDALSRWHLDPKYEKVFNEKTKGMKTKRTLVEELEVKCFW